MPKRTTKHSIKIRLSRDQYKLIAAAASISGQTIAQFIISAAITEAQKIINIKDKDSILLDQ
jgi:uncharacterized protein (DUF1778 family)